ncbi:MAG: hypothetical protein IPK80_25795 [Nannocystis sp.]|nr:hypothetical protein [Nannocystis sp.]
MRGQRAATGPSTTPATGRWECDSGDNNGPGQLCNAMCKVNVRDGDKSPKEQRDDGNNAPGVTAARPAACRGLPVTRSSTRWEGLR